MLYLSFNRALEEIIIQKQGFPFNKSLELLSSKPWSQFFIISVSLIFISYLLIHRISKIAARSHPFRLDHTPLKEFGISILLLVFLSFLSLSKFVG
ncbi:hypothetical protein L1887_34325 [Cichorium endivia]|nr:hypothetical protein L1887_34325 [Cichorium endivia]